MQQRDRVQRARQGVKMGLDLGYIGEFYRPHTGEVILALVDGATGAVLEERTRKNIITLDAGVLAARLFRNSLDPNPAQNNGLTMLAIGTGATGNLLSPDAPQQTQRSLNLEIARKTFSSVQFRNGNGVAVSYPTNVVDFTTVFGESEAVGPLNEMGLMCTASLNPLEQNPLPPGPGSYDPTEDVTGKDIMVNYLCFSVLSKPSNAILSITWRLTF